MNYFYNFDEFSIPPWIKVLYWFLYLVIFVYTLWKTKILMRRCKWDVEVSNLLVVYFIVYTVFSCVNTDYFSYREWQSIEDFTEWSKENIYLYIIWFCRILRFEYPYEVFRLIVWGGAVLIAYQSFRMYRKLMVPGLVLLFLFVFYCGVFSYARASLAMAVYFFGIALFRHKKGIMMKLLGIGVTMSSYLFHHEMIIGIVVLPGLFIPFERKGTSFLSIFGLFIIVLAILFVSTNLEYLDSLFDNDDITSKIDTFNEDEQKVFRLSTFMRYLMFIYPFCMITKCFWKRRAPQSIIGIYRITYAIILVSIAFMIVFGLRSVYAYRILYISMIPMALLFGYCYCNGYFKRNQLLIMMAIALLTNSIVVINAY